MRLMHDARVAACGFTVWLAMAIATPAAAANVTVAWDPSPDPRVTGYVVYFGGQSGFYSESRDVGNVTSFAVTVQPGQSYYFAVAAYAGPAVGSRSAEVSWIPNHPPVLTNPGSQQGTLGSYLSLQLIAIDPEHSALSYQVSGLPQGLFANGTGAIAGTPTAAGTSVVTVSASDGALADTETFTWTIAPPPNDVTPPAISISVPGTGNQPVLVVNQNPNTPPGVNTPVSSAPNVPTAGTTPPVSSPPTGAIARWRDGTQKPSVSQTIWQRATQNASSTAPRTTASTTTTTRTRPWAAASQPQAAATRKAAGGGFQRLKAAVASAAATKAVSAVAATNPAAPAATAQAAGAGDHRSLASSVRAKIAARSEKTITTTKPFLTLAGTAVDNRVIDRVDWTTDSGLTGKATGTDTWIAGVPLQRGLNHVTIKVRDTDGNESSGTMVVEYKGKPSLED